MRRTFLGTALLLLLALAGCDKPGAWGDANSIIVASSPALWAEVEGTVQEALEPRIRTVRDEKMFTVTFQDPGGEHWGRLRQFKQMLLIGTSEEEWLEPAVQALDSLPSPPAIAQVHDVWARDQLVTLVLLPREGDAESLTRRLPELGQLYERQYREWATNRMFLSGRDTVLAEELRRQAGFTLLLPAVYASDLRDSVYVFRNDNPDPSELIRQIAVTWRSGAGTPPDPETLLAWRAEVAGTSYSQPQAVDLRDAETTPIEHRGNPGLQVRAVWQNPPETGWPAAGPFILRGIVCPTQDRTYLLDAWLYAPGKEKYEYMIQLETILDSFRCGPARG